MKIPKKGVGYFKQFITRLLIGKRLLLSNDKILCCPRCKSKMDKLIKDKIEIDVCPYCNGMWLDDGEINKLIKLNGEKNGKKRKN
ncbi:MAG: zf-TFIIB domain-containing protein [Candidatus Woesearchaeota archaeon]